MAEQLASWISGIFGAGIGEYIGVLFVSLLPVIELRGAIPVGLWFGLSWQASVICAIIGNLLPIPFILLFLDYVFKFMKKHHIFEKLVDKMEEKAMKNSHKVDKFKFWGLCFFVAIPLPGTGAWTGALIASVLKMDRKKAFLSIVLGVLISATVVTLLTYGVIGNMFG